MVGNIFGEGLLVPYARVTHHSYSSKPVSCAQFYAVPFCFATRANFLAQKGGYCTSTPIICCYNREAF
jgi:hypothetical protein